ncbi:MAG: glycosyltransferase family 9 protein [Acidobacteriota bacterium]
MKYSRIAIVKLSSLGDIVHTLPALSLLRAEFPASSITWFADPHGAELLKNFSGIDNIVSVDIKSGGILKRAGNIKKIISGYKGKFDLILDFQGLIKSAVLSRLLGKNTAGFGRGNVRESPAGLFYKMKPPLFDESNHVIKKNIHLLSTAGILSDEIAYPVKAMDFTGGMKAFIEKNELETAGYVILNIGGGWESKILSPEQNREILSGIKPDLKKVVLWGNREEEIKADMISEITGAIKVPFMNFNDLILFISNAGTIISADSLPLHIADATGTRSVGIFGPTSPERNGSLNRNNLSIVHKIECSFCYKRKCSHKSCMVNLDLSPINDFVNGD